MFYAAPSQTRLNIILFFSLFFIANSNLFAYVTNLSSPNSVNANITSDTTISVDTTLLYDTTVNAGSTLTIEANVKLTIDNGNFTNNGQLIMMPGSELIVSYSINNNGTIIANGNNKFSGYHINNYSNATWQSGVNSQFNLTYNFSNQGVFTTADSSILSAQSFTNFGNCSFGANSNATFQYDLTNSGFATFENGSIFKTTQGSLNNSGTLTLKQGSAMSVLYSTTNNGSIDVYDQASIVQVDEWSNTSGSGTYKIRKSTGPYYQYDYIYWSSPIENANIQDVFKTSDGFSNYKYKNVPQNFIDIKNGNGYPQTVIGADGYDDNGEDWQNYSSGVMEKGVGYIVLGKGSVFPFNINNANSLMNGYSVEFTGNKVNSSNIDVTLYKDLYHLSNATDYDNDNLNLNLVGNPYPSSIDIKKLFQYNESNLTGDFYFWTHDKPVMALNGPNAYDFSKSSMSKANVVKSGSNYIFTSTASKGYTNGTIVLTPKNAPEFIASGQGFYVSVKNTISSGNTKLSFKNVMRDITQTNKSFLRLSANEGAPIIDRVWLNLTNDEVFRQIAIGFVPELSDGKGDGDTPNIHSANDTDFYSLIPNDNGKYAIQFLSDFNTDKSIPLGMASLTNATYQISLDHAEGIFTQGQAIYLEDTYQGIIHDFANGAYSFTQNAGANINDRFILRFTNSTAATPEAALAQLAVYPNPSTGVFFFHLSSDENAQIEISDLTGKRIQNVVSEELNGNYTLNLTGKAAGVYFAKITTNKGQITKKLVIE